MTTSAIPLYKVQACCKYRAARIKNLSIYMKAWSGEFARMTPKEAADLLLSATCHGIKIGSYSGNEYAIGVAK